MRGPRIWRSFAVLRFASAGQRDRKSRGRLMAKSQFGMIGLAVMGSNLALNVEEHGFSVSVWNFEPERVDSFLKENEGKKFTGTKTLEDFVAALERPRRIMMMIKAGAPVDMTLD